MSNTLFAFQETFKLFDFARISGGGEREGDNSVLYLRIFQRIDGIAQTYLTTFCGILNAAYLSFIAIR